MPLSIKNHMQIFYRLVDMKTLNKYQGKDHLEGKVYSLSYKLELLKQTSSTDICLYILRTFPEKLFYRTLESDCFYLLLWNILMEPGDRIASYNFWFKLWQKKKYSRMLHKTLFQMFLWKSNSLLWVVLKLFLNCLSNPI